MSWLSQIRRFLALLLMSFSFGGFLFYAGVVIPIGSDEVGVTTQGFVTRSVTNYLNIATALTLLILAWEVYSGKHRRGEWGNRLFVVFVAGIAACWITLVILHPQLERMLDLEAKTVEMPERFYDIHRIYLWASSIQWACSLPLLWILANAQSKRKKSAHR